MPLIVNSQPPDYKKHLDTYEIVITVFIGLVIFGGFVSWKYFRVEEKSSLANDTPQAAYQESTPTPTPSPTETPRTNPFENTNPFANQYENPFN
jgi:hypothetical protein